MGERPSRRLFRLMHASAFLTVTSTPGATWSRIARLHSDSPLVLRPTIPVKAEPMGHWHRDGATPVRVSLTAGAAGPVGGDDFRLDIDVEADASLILRSIAATLVLPGPLGEASRLETSVRVAAGGVLVWMPRPTIAARNCRHHSITTVMLEPGASLLLREELLLGRHGEQPGDFHQRLRVCLGDRTIYDQELVVGPGAAGWRGSAVIGSHQAVGSVLIVDPEWDRDPAYLDVATTSDVPDTVLLPLSASAMLVTSLAPDGLALRQRLDAGVAMVEARSECACSD